MLGNELSGQKRGSIYWASFIKHVLHILYGHLFSRQYSWCGHWKVVVNVGFCISPSHSERLSCLCSSPSCAILCSVHLCYRTCILAQQLLTFFPARVLRSSAQASFTKSFPAITVHGSGQEGTPALPRIWWRTWSKAALLVNPCLCN